MPMSDRVPSEFTAVRFRARRFQPVRRRPSLFNFKPLLGALVVLCGLLALVPPGMAQDEPQSQENAPPVQESKPAPPPAEPIKAKRTYPTPKFDLSAGYNYRSYYSPSIGILQAPGTLSMNGFYASLDYNRYRYLAYEGEITEAAGNQGGVGGINGELHIFTMLAGARFNPLHHRKLTPFIHGLAGDGLYYNVVPNYSNFHGGAQAIDKFSYEMGGGIDLDKWTHWGIRLLEFDYGNANFYSNTSTFTNGGSHRISVGFVYRFGQR